MEPGPELLMPLLPYQKEFLAWAIKQEQSAVRGGVLAGMTTTCWCFCRQGLTRIICIWLLGHSSRCCHVFGLPVCR